MANDYKALAEKRVKYSEDIYYLNYSNSFELWLNYELVKTFNSIKEVNKYLFDEYMNKEKDKDKKRVYVYTPYFEQIYEIYERIKDDCALTIKNYRNHTDIVAFQIFGSITYKEIKYYLGTDKIEDTNPCNFCELIERYHKNEFIKLSFNGSIKDICLNKDMEEFGSKESVPYHVIEELFKNASLAPIIYSDINKEFKNVYCYDFDSAYISKYFQFKYPKNFKRCSVDSKCACLLRLRIKNIKAKNPKFCCLSVADKKNGVKLITPTKKSKRVLFAEEITVTVFWFELEIIDKYYTYDEIIRERAWAAEFEKLPKSFCAAVLEVYNTKEQAKINNEPYADKKVLLNRIHGFFISRKTLHDKIMPLYPQMPIQVSFFTIALQRYLMIGLIEQIGLENIVSAHTDSIKTKGNYDEIVERLNEKYKIEASDTLGKLEFEGIMERVVYFSNTRAKYIMDGKFKIKHGGIWLRDAEEIVKNYTYDTFNSNSIYGHTIKKMFSSEGEKNYLKCIKEERVFSEVDNSEE